MRLFEYIGKALRPIRSDEAFLLESDPDIASEPHSIEMRSPVFEDGGEIPREYTADGASLFPTLKWKNVPADSKSLLLVVEDPDAPKPLPFVHGIFYNIPALLEELPETTVMPDGITEKLANVGVHMGTNSLARPVYMAPTPPPGHGPHHYHFQLFALDTELSFDSDPTLLQIREAIKDHVLATGELVGVYQR